MQPSSAATTGTSIGTGASAGRRIAVDTAAVESAARALAQAARIAFDARAVAGRATDGAGWAVEAPLPDALHRFRVVLDAALARLVDDAREAAAELSLAAYRYAEAERLAGAGAAAGRSGASRDASAPGEG
jgi:hypothetical protein